MRNDKALALQRIWMSIVMFAIVCADQTIKQLVKSHPIGKVMFRLDSVFEIVNTLNKGAAFSVMSGRTALLLIATTGMLFFLALTIFVYPQISQTARWCFVVLLGGGIGNWLDRILYGGVTDYIRVLFIRFPVFNLADICISVSVILLILLLVTDHFDPMTGE